MIRTPYLGIAPRAALATGAAGAIVGGSIAAARNIGKVRRREISREDAVRDVIKESGTTGISTAMATATVSAVGLTGMLSLLGFVTVAVGAKYLADKSFSARTGPCLESEASTPAAPVATGKSKPKKNG